MKLIFIDLSPVGARFSRPFLKYQGADAPCKLGN